MGEIIKKTSGNSDFDQYIRKVAAINAAMGVAFGVSERLDAIKQWNTMRFGDDTASVSDTCLAAYSSLDD